MQSRDFTRGQIILPLVRFVMRQGIAGAFLVRLRRQPRTNRPLWIDRF